MQWNSFSDHNFLFTLDKIMMIVLKFGIERDYDCSLESSHSDESTIKTYY